MATFRIEASWNSRITRIGALPDQTTLHGVLAQIQALGLELVEVRRLASKGN